MSCVVQLQHQRFPPSAEGAQLITLETSADCFYLQCLSPFGDNQAGCAMVTTETYAIKCPGHR